MGLTMRALWGFIGVLWLSAQPTTAHEFWIEPEQFFIDAGDTLSTRLYVGQNLEGVENAFIPRRLERFEWSQAGLSRPVEMSLGDRPAFAMMAQTEGVVTVMHQTRPQSLTYSKWEKFIAFCEEKDFLWAADEHLERGLPQTGFKERYVRYAKSLIHVGDGPDVTQNYGLRYEFELIGGAKASGAITLQLLFEGAPERDVQTTVFTRAPSGEVSVLKTRTNSAGFVTIERQAGHIYLVDAVRMLPLEPQKDDGFAWESLWASITFSAQ